MNIIFYRYKSICEPDYIDAFKSIGIEVIEDRDGISNDHNLSLEQKISNLGTIIAENKPLFVFSINYYPFISMLCEKLHVFYVAMTVDCPVFEIFNTTIRNKFNRLFLFDKDQYELIKNENPECISHLPLGAAPSRVSTLLGDTSDYKYDISLVGSLYNEKDPLFGNTALPKEIMQKIKAAIEMQLNENVYGYDVLKSALDTAPEILKALKDAAHDFYPSDMSVFDISDYVALCDYLCPHATYLERLKTLNSIGENTDNNTLHLFTQSDTKELLGKIKVHGGVNSLTEMPFVFRQSKINLNITTRSITSGLSQRIWDVLACKGFLITNYQPEIDMFFRDGVHLVTYSSRDELIEKINYYLSHEREREEIAQNGYELVCQSGKVSDRVISMIAAITGA